MASSGVTVLNSASVLDRVVANMKDHRIVRERIFNGQQCLFVEASVDVCKRLIAASEEE